MGLIHRSPAAVGVRALAAVWLAGLVLALVTAGPSLAAAPSPIRLSLPSVSDRSSAVGEPVTFRVEYRHRGGLEPVSVVARVGPATYRMTPDGDDGNVHRGVTFAVVASPPAGKLHVRFEAVDPDGAVGSLDDGWITVTAPPPPPTPEPASPPPAAPAAVTGGGATSGGSDPDEAGADPGTSGPSVPLDGASTVGRAPLADRFGESRDPGEPAVSSPVASSPRPTRVAVNAPTARDPRPIPSRLSTDPSIWLATGAIPGLPASLLTADEVATMLVSTVGGAAMVMAFLLFGRRRPDDDDDAAEAGRSAAACADAALASGAMAVAVEAGQAPGGPMADPESAIPRWRRPSLLEARKHDPSRAPEPAPAPRLTFDSARAQPGDDLERRRIRYRVVRLLDSPDELVASEIGLLDEGDEVALCERSGSYWLVLCPDGSRGWVHRMVLGEVIDADAAREERVDQRDDDELIEPGLAARFTATRPAPTWSYQLPATDANAGGADPDRMHDDVLAAYRAARARA